MDTDKALDLVKTGIEGLLEGIGNNTDPWISCEEFANGYQITDVDVFEYLVHHEDVMMRLVVGESNDNIDAFCNLIISVLNSEWYEEKYQFYLSEVQTGIEDEADWERTKKSLKPTWTP